MKKIILIILVFVSLLISINENVYGVFASQLDEGINEQLENIDLSELEEYFNNVTSDNKDFFTYISSLLKGDRAISCQIQTGTFSYTGLEVHGDL